MHVAIEIADPTDTTSCFFMIGHSCYCLITTTSGIKLCQQGLDTAVGLQRQDTRP